MPIPPNPPTPPGEWASPSTPVVRDINEARPWAPRTGSKRPTAPQDDYRRQLDLRPTKEAQREAIRSHGRDYIEHLKKALKELEVRRHDPGERKSRQLRYDLQKRAEARQKIKSLPKAAQENIKKALSKGLGKGKQLKLPLTDKEIVWSNLRKLLMTTGKKALPFGTALALWELAGRPDFGMSDAASKGLKSLDFTARSRNRDRSSEASGHVEDRLRQLVSPAPW